MPGKHTGPVNMVTAADAEALGFHGAKLAGAERLLADYVAEGHIAGAVSLVARRGNIAQLLAVGHADIESDAPMAADTLFRVFSLTKPVTSVAALMLVERGRVSLDAPVADYIPAFRDIPVFVGEEGGRLVTEPARRPPTVRHLLTQTSGIAGTAMPPREPLTAVYRRARIGDENLTLEETVDKLAEIPLLFHPGEQWRYGVSTDVLARVVEVASGMRFGDFLRENIFEPLEMHDTGFAVPQEKAHRLATLYTAMPSGELRPMRQGGRGARLGPSMDGASKSQPTPRPIFHAAPGRRDGGTSAAGMNSDPIAHAHQNREAGSSILNAQRPLQGPRPAPGIGTGADFALAPALQSGSSGLVSTVLDYFRFAQMLLSGGTWRGRRLLSPQSVDTMRQNQLPRHLLPYRMPWPHVARYTQGCGFGFGVRVVLDVEQWGVPGSVGEFGWAGAANTYLWIDPAEEVVALLFTQAFPFMHTPLDTEFKRLVYEAMVR